MSYIAELKKEKNEMQLQIPKQSISPDNELGRERGGEDG